MANYSPAAAAKQIEGQVNRTLRQQDWSEVTEKGRQAVLELQQSLADAKTYTQDYELSEMRDEQLENAKKAKKYLRHARQQILRASEFNVFGPIDVAHLSAQIDQLIGELN